jgi:tRNA threonylcarbamoyladenosine biosynthesis protein TsaE
LLATTTLPEVLTSSAAETEAEGEKLGRELERGALLLLVGPLGAGKTTFVRGLARGVGSQDDVASPTFVFVRVYHGRVQLAHVDLYRLKAAAELPDLALEELLDQGAVVVEWGDRLQAPGARVITIEPEGGDRRRIQIDP